MAKRSAYELFEQYYQTLSFLLPMKDASFIEDLFKHNLFTGDVNLELMSTSKEKASYLLDNVIKSELVLGYNKCFVDLLTVMNNSKYDNVKDLAKQIESEFDNDAKCEHLAIMYSYSYYVLVPILLAI